MRNSLTLSCLRKGNKIGIISNSRLIVLIFKITFFIFHLNFFPSLSATVQICFQSVWRAKTVPKNVNNDKVRWREHKPYWHYLLLSPVTLSRRNVEINFLALNEFNLPQPLEVGLKEMGWREWIHWVSKWVRQSSACTMNEIKRLQAKGVTEVGEHENGCCHDHLHS